MITEDYVSFETSKLLKEKGFDWMCNGYYNKDDEDSEPYFGDGEGADNWNEQASSVRDFWFSAPTLQMAMKWLREVHKIIITIDYNDDSDCEDNERYGFSVDCTSCKGVDLATYATYEEACEEAIKHCLKYLIQ